MSSINSTLVEYLEGKNGGDIQKYFSENLKGMLNSQKSILYGLDNRIIKNSNIVRNEVATFTQKACLDLNIPFSSEILKLLDDVEGTGIMGSSYRDHYLHTVLVFILGCYIVDQCDLLKKYFSDKDLWEKKFIKIWYITAIYHDFSYFVMETDDGFKNRRLKMLNDFVLLKKELPSESEIKDYDTLFWEYILWHGEQNEIKLNRTFRFIQEFAYKNWENLEFYNGNIKNIETFKGKEIFKYIVGTKRMTELGFNKDIKSYYKEKLDHGIVSALLLKKFLILSDEFLKQNNIECKQLGIDEMGYEFDEDMSLALEAIALHNIRPKEKYIRMKIDIKNPYAWLLALCDGLQCWDRSYFGTKRRGKKPLLSCAIDIRFDRVKSKFLWISNDNNLPHISVECDGNL
ncbi:hypothetical protein KM800_04570 [Clostridium tyrobutyricum]|uniref:hypothetical protein n=1 Tax=Clostridium tyrobutyricum TaxID=1519 RepID=UPI001C38A6FC|nr:hypothetical protein [Clostridium tyrobutyricum]MBV4418602.1 hypothetical protein [Clostridium tyrobutyricum]